MLKTMPSKKQVPKQEKFLPKTGEKLVPDTSVIIEGLVSRKIEEGELKPNQIIIHEAVLGELEHQANQNRETGYIGLEEIKKLRDLASKYGFTVLYKGNRPDEFTIKMAKSGGIDNLIRELALKEQAMLLTADRVQALVAQAKGITVTFIEFEMTPTPIALEDFFDTQTMSVHLRENVAPFAKRGTPGNWGFVKVREALLTREELTSMAKEIVEEANMRADGFVEIQRKGSTIVQLGRYRIVITKPPLSDGWEITAVRPVKILALDDYELSQKLKDRIAKQAEGILVAGAPGNGKSTFAQALAEFYASQDKIVKTVEAPRDLQVSDNITQYAISQGTPQEIHDILLLSRPDYTIFDEMRNTEDFELFADMRLAGVGMIGIVHGTNPIDAVQRFIGRIELGVIPAVVDTVLFIKDGSIHKVFSIKMEVKVPSGMTEADLARPIVTVTDFETGKLEYEIYSYGDQTVVIPVKPGMSKSPLYALAAKQIEQEFLAYTDHVSVDLVADNKCIVHVPEDAIPAIIGRQGANISALEKELGISIEVRELTRAMRKQQTRQDKQRIAYDVHTDRDIISFFLEKRYAHADIDLVVDGDVLLTAKASKKGVIKIKKDNNIGNVIAKALQAGKDVELRV